MAEEKKGHARETAYQANVAPRGINKDQQMSSERNGNGSSENDNEFGTPSS